MFKNYIINMIVPEIDMEIDFELKSIKNYEKNEINLV